MVNHQMHEVVVLGRRHFLQALQAHRHFYVVDVARETDARRRSFSN
jgi:hypothetical protein